MIDPAYNATVTFCRIVHVRLGVDVGADHVAWVSAVAEHTSTSPTATVTDTTFGAVVVFHTD